MNSLCRSISAGFAERQTTILNGAGLAATVLGVVVQSWIERWHMRRRRQRAEDAVGKIREAEREKVIAELPPPPAPSPSIWDKLMGRKKKAA